MNAKQVILKVTNRWYDSIEKAGMWIESPTGKTVEIKKNDLFGVKLDEKVDNTLRRFVKETKMWDDEVEFVSNVNEMRDLLSIASRIF